MGLSLLYLLSPVARPDQTRPEQRQTSKAGTLSNFFFTLGLAVYSNRRPYLPSLLIHVTKTSRQRGLYVWRPLNVFDIWPHPHFFHKMYVLLCSSLAIFNPSFPSSIGVEVIYGYGNLLTVTSSVTRLHSRSLIQVEVCICMYVPKMTHTQHNATMY